MKAFFKGMPLEKAWELSVAFKLEGGSAAASDLNKLMAPYISFTTSYVSMKTGLGRDALRLKVGSSVGLAVRCGPYPLLIKDDGAHQARGN